MASQSLSRCLSVQGLCICRQPGLGRQSKVTCDVKDLVLQKVRGGGLIFKGSVISSEYGIHFVFAMCYRN